MSLTTLSRKWVREIDRRAVQELGISSLVLMENAGRGAAELILERPFAEPFVVVCGKGNNGGDGLVVARQLDLGGKQVQVATAGSVEDCSADAAANLHILEKAGASIVPCFEESNPGEVTTAFRQALGEAGTVIDALLGTGVTGDPRPPLDRLIEMLNAAAAQRIALDTPSGLDVDSGAPGNPTFRANFTITFAALKPGLIQPQAKPYVGEVALTHIGVPRMLLRQIECEAAKE